MSFLMLTENAYFKPNVNNKNTVNWKVILKIGFVRGANIVI